MYDAYNRPPAWPVGRSWYATLVSFPISCFILTLLTDLAYWHTASFQWETMSVWLLTVGLAFGGVVILAGIADLVRSRRVQCLAQPWLRVLGQGVAYGLSVINVFVHSRDGYTAVIPQGLTLSALAVFVLLFTTLLSRQVIVRHNVGGLV